MARKKPRTVGGKTLAIELTSFIKENINEMKKSNASAADNEKNGIEDMANVIAFAIEKVMSGMLVVVPGPTTTTPLITPVGGPVAGAIDLSLANPKYTFK